jgi:hypothetical protein
MDILRPINEPYGLMKVKEFLELMSEYQIFNYKFITQEYPNISDRVGGGGVKKP